MWLCNNECIDKRTIVSIILVAFIFPISAAAALAYNDPGPASSSNSGSSSSPACNSDKPQKGWLYRVKSLGKGKYQLYWYKADRATSWTVGFGTQPGKYIYGVHNFGNDQSRNLIINTFSTKKFYFAVRANNGCMPGDWSNEMRVGTVVTVVRAPAVKGVTTNRVIPPVVTTAPATVPEVQAPVVNTAPLPISAPVSHGVWGWLTGLFK